MINHAEGPSASDLLADVDLATVDEVRMDRTGADRFADLWVSPWEWQAARSDLMADVVSDVVAEFLALGLELTEEDFAAWGAVLDERLYLEKAVVDAVDVAMNDVDDVVQLADSEAGALS